MLIYLHIFQNPKFHVVTSHSFFIIICVFVFQGLTNPLGKPVCSFDPDGLIFAAGVESQAIKLYDLRAFDKVKCKLSVLTGCVFASVRDCVGVFCTAAV